MSSGRDAERALERVEGELDRRRVRRHEPRLAPRPELDLDVRALAAPPRAASRSNAGAIASGSWPGARRIETFASASTGSTVFCSTRRAALDPVDVERRLGPRAQVELLGRARVRRPRALVARARPRPRGSVDQLARSSSVSGAIPARSGSGEPAVLRRDRSEDRRQRMRRVSAAPPYMPEWRSRSPVRTLRWK